MTLGKFNQQNGAAADVAELEYISALHQSGLHVRPDGSICAEDIRLFLSSRYGIDVTDDAVKQTILRGLGGGNDTIDLMEVVACLLIPTFLKASHQLRGCPLPTHVVPTQDELIPLGLKVILNDATGSASPKAITTDLVRRILEAYGEVQMAQDTELLQEMVDCCGESSSSRYLTVEAFTEALSSDLHLFDLENEVRLATNVNDVFMTDDVESFRLSKTESISMLAASERESKLGQRKGLLAFALPLQFKTTLSQIDITAATYRSKPLMIFLWSTFLITYFTYLFETLTKDLDEICGETESSAFVYSANAPWRSNSGAILCQIFASVILWLVYFLTISFFGVVFITLGSTGNSVKCQKWWIPLIGAVAVCSPVILLYSAKVREVRLAEETGQDSGAIYLDVVSLVLGAATVCYHLFHSASLAFPSLRKIKLVSRWLVSNSVYAEMKQKRSAAEKVANMTTNAMEIVSSDVESDVSQTYYGKALQSYSKTGKKCVEAGGFTWSWNNILRKDGMAYNGIWMSARLVASNVAQYIVSLYVLFIGIDTTRRIAEEYDKEDAEEQLSGIVNRTLDTAADEELTVRAVDNVTSMIQDFLATNTEQRGVDYGCSNFTETSRDFFDQHCSTGIGTYGSNCTRDESVNYLCPLLSADDLTAEERLALLSASGFDHDALSTSLQGAVDQAAKHAVNSLYPSEKYMVVVPAVVATVFAFLVALYLSLSYMPSVLNTILKLRSGEIPTLHNPYFFKYRTAPDLVAILTGSLFWGAIGSSIVVAGTFALIVFFFLWQVTAYYAQRFVALVSGMLLITLVRILFLQTQRRRIFKAFYRERPRAANILLLALEWAYFSLTAGYIVVRIIKLLLCAAACIGRIDTPFLAPGIGRIGPIDLDHYPSVHLQEILSHEAHRHPYIEMLGVTYLMKMRYGDRFGNRACSAWRLLFVYALFPWLHQYRIAARPGMMNDMDQKKSRILENPSSILNLASGMQLSNRMLQRQLSSKSENLTFCDVEFDKQNERIRDLEEEVKLLKSRLRVAEGDEGSTLLEVEPITPVVEEAEDSSGELKSEEARSDAKLTSSSPLMTERDIDSGRKTLVAL